MPSTAKLPQDGHEESFLVPLPDPVPVATTRSWPRPKKAFNRTVPGGRMAGLIKCTTPGFSPANALLEGFGQPPG